MTGILPLLTTSVLKTTSRQHLPTVRAAVEVAGTPCDGESPVPAHCPPPAAVRASHSPGRQPGTSRREAAPPHPKAPQVETGTHRHHLRPPRFGAVKLDRSTSDLEVTPLLQTSAEPACSGSIYPKFRRGRCLRYLPRRWDRPFPTCVGCMLPANHGHRQFQVSPESRPIGLLRFRW